MAKYQQYKDSGFEWLGEVPSHWKVCRLKHVKANKPNAFVDGPFGSNLKSIHFVDDGDVYVIESNFATTGIINEDNLKTITSNHFQTISRSEAEVGDIIIAKIGARFGMSSILPKLTKKSVVSGNSLKLTINSKVCNTEYVHYLLQHSKSESAMDDGVNVTAQPALSLGGLNNLPFLLPSSEEQDNITKFLSYETAQIDTLIEKQQTLIQLLKEKRQAVISHAVTKGLNSDAPMKDSGVEWLGEVPEHWGVGRVGYYGQVLNGSTPSKANLSYWHPKEVAWLSSGEVNQYYIESPTDYISYKALKECSVTLLPVGTLVMGMIGQGKTRGTSAVTKIEATINQNLAAVIPNENLYSNYAHLFFQAAYKELREDARGGNQAALNCEIIRDFKITIPPINEQKAIFIEVNKISDKFDILMIKAEQAIQLMQERRTALISAAVTGKIDVRGWRVPD